MEKPRETVVRGDSPFHPPAKEKCSTVRYIYMLRMYPPFSTYLPPNNRTVVVTTLLCLN